MKLSVVIVSVNEAANIGVLLERLLSTRTIREVADAGSTDGTLDLIWPPVRRVTWPRR